jgi:hypothetical protein
LAKSPRIAKLLRAISVGEPIRDGWGLKNEGSGFIGTAEVSFILRARYFWEWELM